MLEVISLNVVNYLRLFLKFVVPFFKETVVIQGGWVILVLSARVPGGMQFFLLWILLACNDKFWVTNSQGLINMEATCVYVFLNWKNVGLLTHIVR